MAEKRGRDRRQSREQTFGIAVVVIERAGVQPMLREGVEAAVKPRGEVGVGIEEWDVATRHTEAGHRNETKESPVTDEQSSCDCDEDGCAAAGVPDREADESGDEIAGGNAREHAEDPEVRPVEVRERGEEHLDRENSSRAAEDVAGERGAAVAAGHAHLRGKHDRDANEEEEAREDEVGEGEAIPGSVIKLRVDMAPVAGIVDEDHQRDGEAA